MTNPIGCRVATYLSLTAAILAGAGIGCGEQPVVTQMTEPATAGGVQFNATGYELRHLELNADGQTVQYNDPVLAVTIEITNQADKPLTYTPSHRTQQMNEATTALLYKDPGKSVSLPPASKETISGVYLERGHLDGQITSPKTLQKGQSLTDIILFEVPQADKAALVLSLPPQMHRAKAPVLIRIPYTRKTPKGPTIHDVDEPISVGGATLTVTGSSIEYLSVDHTIEGKGFSSKPRLKVAYTVKNNDDEPITYSPEHNVDGARGASLYGGSTTFQRVTLPVNTSIKGQIEDDTPIKPGKAVTDFALFERPPKATKRLTFEYPASHFGRSGLLRVDLPYEYSDPKLPEELQKGQKTADKND